MNGTNLQTLRHAHGFSQQDFAELLGISRRTLGTLEQSPENIPPKYHARLRHLGISPDEDEPPPNVGPVARASPSPPASASYSSPLVPVPDGFNTNTLYNTDTAPTRAFQDDESDDDEICENEGEVENYDETDSYIPTTPHHSSHPALPPEPFVVDSIPGNTFRILRQHLEITNARLVRLSGLKLPDIEHAESGTMLVPPTLFEALLAASELPTLNEPDHSSPTSPMPCINAHPNRNPLHHHRKCPYYQTEIARMRLPLKFFTTNGSMTD